MGAIIIPLRVEVQGIEELRAKIRNMGEELATVLEDAANQGAMIVVREAQLNSAKGGGFPNRITGNLFRSIPAVSPVTVSKSRNRVEVAVGSSAEYARRLELGFVGTDSLGRRYHQSPRPYIKPALDTNRKRVEEEMAKRFRQVIGGYT